jgi:hypothetical protein
VDDLTAFKAALSEDYAVADMLAVHGTIWSTDKHNPEIVRSKYGWVAALCREDELTNGALRADHIARNDPRRAKLDIKAKRTIIEEYERDPQADDQYLAGLAFAIDRLAEVYSAPWWRN